MEQPAASECRFHTHRTTGNSYPHSSAHRRSTEKTEEYTPFQPFLSLEINHILLNGTQLQYSTPQNDPYLQVKYDQLKIEDLWWNLEELRTLDLGNFEVHSPTIGWSVTGTASNTAQTKKTEAKRIPEILYPYAEKLTLQHFFPAISN